MIIIKIFGGLGNQMFQYAFARSLSIKYNRRLIIDKTYFNKENYPFNLHPKYYPYKLNLYNTNNEFISSNISKYIKNVRRKRIYSIANPIVSHSFFRQYIPEYFNQRNFSFKNTKKSKIAFIDGYWQKFKIVEEYKNDISKNLTLKDENISELNKKIINRISSTNSVSVHFRRGDYISNPKFLANYEICSLKYYKSAMDYIKKIVNDAVFYIFSDDINWVKKNMNFEYSIVFIDNNEPDHEHQYLMSQCKHNIIANSSFSWWGAWLNKNPDKIVIAPAKWFRSEDRKDDIYYPKSWVRCEN